MKWNEVANEQRSMRQTIMDVPEESLREILIQLQDKIGPLPIDRFIKHRKELADWLFELKRQLRSKEKTMGKIEPADGPDSN